MNRLIIDKIYNVISTSNKLTKEVGIEPIFYEKIKFSL